MGRDAGDSPSLGNLRDNGPFSARLSQKSSLKREVYALFKKATFPLSTEYLKGLALDENVLSKRAWETRRSIWNAINWRYLTGAPSYVGTLIKKASNKGIDSPEFLSASYLFFCLRDRLVFETVTELLWSRWQQHVTSISREEILGFMESLGKNNPPMTAWSTATKNKLASNILTSLRDFGILRGLQKKYIQKPLLADEIAFQLLRILFAEGKRGYAVILSDDWKLFLLAETEVAGLLARMSQRGWIRFERAGRTVILEIVGEGDVP